MEDCQISHAQREGAWDLTERREGQNRTYTVIVYNRAAQQFILDNLDAVIGLSAQPKEQSEDAQMQGQPWTTTHD